MQTKTTFRSLDLPRIARRDSQDPIRAFDTCREEVETVPAEVCVLPLQFIGCFQRESEEPIDWVLALPELALVSQVVEHHDASGLLVCLVPLVLVEEEEREKPGLPVIRNEAHLLAVGRAAELQHEGRLGRRHGEEAEAEEVVLVVAPHRVAIDTRSAKAVMIHKDVVTALASPVLLTLVEVSDFMLLAVEPHLGPAHVLALLVLPVARRHGHRPVAPDSELVGVGAGHHGQAACLRPRVQLGGNDDNRGVEVPCPISRWAVFGL
mmetsp:Transcript_51732/g.150209  ORF Transcript_51732/g.150209 Transcript_51732/m.150209 type:complete len:265 (-) Transcript_51732:248-1042(-)